MPESRFRELYRALNAEQRQAVDSIDGPVMVIAGPGTGKTSILTLRIANILRLTDTSPSSILALTFTESGVHSMRRKLVEIIGPSGFRVHIHTFHNFCNEVIKRYPQEFPRIIGAGEMSELDQIMILEKITLTTALRNLKPSGNPFFYLKPILSEIKDLKREDIDPAQYKKILQTIKRDFEAIEDLYHKSGAHKGEMKGKYKSQARRIENSVELQFLYEKYEKALEEKRLYDYEDMIMEVLRELRKSKDLLLELQENYQYILADEHQDANNAQNKLLELLSGFHDSPNLFIVGDEKQAIFRFQGASLENFMYFKRRFKDAKVITLKKNYRSTQKILDASYSLISKNRILEKDLRVRLEAVVEGRETPISLYTFESQDEESLSVATRAKNLIGSGTSPEEIAVLYRDNKDVMAMMRAFDLVGVAYTVHSDGDLFADSDMRALANILRAINDFGDEEKLAQILFLDYFGLDHLDVFKLLKASHRKRIPLYELMRDTRRLKNEGIEKPYRLRDLYAKLHYLSQIAKKASVVGAFEKMVEEIGLVSHFISRPGARDKLTLLDLLLGQITTLQERYKHYTLHDYISFLDTLAKHNVSTRTQGFSFSPGKVNLMTAHRSKGLEFDHVFCVGLNDGHWGGRRMQSYFLSTSPQDQSREEDLEDERRLLYVALTRARKNVYVSYPKKDVLKRDLLPSQFLEEIDPSLLRVVRTKRATQMRTKKLVRPPSKDSNSLEITEKKYLQKVFLDEGMSVSAFNNYLDCPWRFFFLNLLRIPKARERYQLYGTAIHETLRAFFDKYREEKTLSKRQFILLFEGFLRRKPFSVADHDLFLKRGKEALSGYYDAYKEHWPRPIVNELNIAGVYVPFEKRENKKLLLKGVIDKVEIGSGDSVTVVDYKTGKPRSRKEIEGTTTGSDGDYKRQLVFYKILLDGYENGRFNMKNGVIDFIEPDRSGKYKRETFEITHEDTQKLVEDISRIAQEIYNLEFWDRRCEDTSCEYCRLKEGAFGTGKPT